LRQKKQTAISVEMAVFIANTRTGNFSVDSDLVDALCRHVADVKHSMQKAEEVYLCVFFSSMRKLWMVPTKP
jgi:hypothetical protein